MNKILVITQIDDVDGLLNKLKKLGRVRYLVNPSEREMLEIIHLYNVIFTNPNNTRIYLGKKILSKAKNLKVICTASTGTIHIDVEYLKQRNIKLISLKREISVLNKISSTAELALTLMFAHLRNLIGSVNSVIDGNWDYSNFTGNQISSKKIGVMGYGRLGKKFANYCSVFGAEVYVYDPFVKVINKKFHKIEKLSKFIGIIDILSIHIHAENNIGIINKDVFQFMKKNIIMVNSSRGEVVNERDLISFLNKNKLAKYATDVLSDETKFKDNKIYKMRKYQKVSNQILITPHIGGMTKEGKDIAFNHSVKLLKKFLEKF